MVAPDVSPGGGGAVELSPGRDVRNDWSWLLTSLPGLSLTLFLTPDLHPGLGSVSNHRAGDVKNIMPVLSCTGVNLEPSKGVD